ncbi:hypothetical protein N510_002873 [Firmicutes bacterium ASF500]|nr:hypothetical protein N510_002873 [Firmicutes bacterium ASF500]
MADTMIDGLFDLAQRYQAQNSSAGKATNKAGSDDDFDPTINRTEEKDKLEQKLKDKGTLDFTDMLGLMVAQFQNQTIDNQASTSDMMNQLVQMSSMQAMTEMSTQMKELTLANVMSYSASLVGQTVTIGVWDADSKELEEIVGVVEGAGTYDGQQVIFVNGKSYLLSSIMAVGKLPPPKDPDGGDKTDPVDPPEGGDETDPVDPPEGGDKTDPPAEGGGADPDGGNTDEPVG